MAGLETADPGKRAFDVVIFGDDDTVVDLSEYIESGFRHLPGGLADRDQQRTALAGMVIPQSTLYGGIREDCGEGGANNRVCIQAEGLVHDRASRGLFTTLMGAPST